jgi:hypothetical protein
MDSGSRDGCLLTSWRDQSSKNLVRWYPDDHLGQTESARVSLVTARGHYWAMGMALWLPQVVGTLEHVLSGT